MVTEDAGGLREIVVSLKDETATHLSNIGRLDGVVKNDMTNKAIKFLEAHESDTPSRFVEEAIWRKGRRYKNFYYYDIRLSGTISE